AQVTVRVGEGKDLMAGGAPGTNSARATNPSAKETPATSDNGDRGSRLYDEAMAARHARDSEKALSLLRHAAKLGEARAMLQLGKIFRAGDGVTRDYGEAFRWFSRGAEAGNPASMVFLGAMYAQGIGAEKNLNQAISWFRKAAYLGETVGMDGLGQMY